MHPFGAPASCALGRRPQGVLTYGESIAQVPPQAGRRTARFFTSFPGAGSRGNLPQAFGTAFFFCSRNRFFLGPSKKKWVQEIPGQERGFLRAILTQEKDTLLGRVSFYISLNFLLSATASSSQRLL